MFRGYIFSRHFLNERVPQHIQNIVLRDYCKKNNLHFLMSSTEYTMENSFIILNQILNKLNKIDGIVMYSLFQLPEDNEKRLNIFNKIIKKKKQIHFALEGLKLKTRVDIERIDMIWLSKKTLKNCPIEIKVD